MIKTSEIVYYTGDRELEISVQRQFRTVEEAFVAY
jgi:hypothetical protein